MYKLKKFPTYWVRKTKTIKITRFKLQNKQLRGQNINKHKNPNRRSKRRFKKNKKQTEDQFRGGFKKQLQQLVKDKIEKKRWEIQSKNGHLKKKKHFVPASQSTELANGRIFKETLNSITSFTLAPTSILRFSFFPSNFLLN